MISFNERQCQSIMARTKTQPGPKSPLKNVEVLIRLPSECAEGEAISLLEAFKQATQDYAEQQNAQGNRVYGNGASAFIQEILRQYPAIKAKLRHQSEFSDQPKTDQKTH